MFRNKKIGLIIVVWFVCGVFIAPTAEDNKKIYEFNYAATKLAIENAMSGKPTAQEVVAGKDSAQHPFRGF